MGHDQAARKQWPMTEWRRAKWDKMRTLSAIIRRARIDRGWTQEELSERVTQDYEHVATGHVGRLESPRAADNQADITFFRLWALCLELGIPLGDLERDLLSASGAPPMPAARREQQAAALMAIFQRLDERDADTLMDLARNMERRPRAMPLPGPVPVEQDDEAATRAAGLAAMDALLDEAERGAGGHYDSGGPRRRVRHPRDPHEKRDAREA